MNIPIDLKNTTLQTDRLILRPWTWDDLDDFYAYASVDGVGQMAGWNPHRSPDESREILAKFIEHGNVFAIEHREDRRVIGSLGLHTTRWEYLPQKENPYADLRTVEIGYVLSKTYWGQGLMPEAVNTVIHWLFNEEQLDFIIVGHFDHNIRSKRVIEKCGFQYLKTTKFETRYDTVENSMEYILYHPERRESGC